MCKTPAPPAPPIPIPYPNIGKAADTTGGPTNVTTDGCMPMVKGAKYAMSSGDEPGVAGGIVSGVNGGGVVSNTIKGKAEFVLYSFDVKFDGKNVCRLGDPLFHNKKNIMG